MCGTVLSCASVCVNSESENSGDVCLPMPFTDSVTDLIMSFLLLNSTVIMFTRPFSASDRFHYPSFRLPHVRESLNGRYEIVNYSGILCLTVHYVWCRFYDPPYLHSPLRFLDHCLSVNRDLLPKIHRILFHIFGSLNPVVCHTVNIDAFYNWKTA